MWDKTDLVFDASLVSASEELGFTNVHCVDNESVVLVSDKKNISRFHKKKAIILAPAVREFFEDKRVSVLVSPGLLERKDSVHYRRSLTQVEANLAKNNNKVVLFLFSDLLAAKDQSVLLGRWAQDKKVLEKKGVEHYLVSGAHNEFELRSRKDLAHFWKTLRL